MTAERAKDRFNGKQVVITGAASGIGRATAHAVARLGGRVHLTDRSPDLLAATAADLREAGHAVGAVAALDIRDIDAVRDFAAAVHELTPHADIVMNIAGISAGRRRAARTSAVARHGRRQPDGADPHHRSLHSDDGGRS